eukprot:648485-Prymnesium_polylepis.1
MHNQAVHQSRSRGQALRGGLSLSLGHARQRCCPSVRASSTATACAGPLKARPQPGALQARPQPDTLQAQPQLDTLGHGRSRARLGTAGRASGTAGRASGTAGRASGPFGRASGTAGRASGTAGRASGTFGRASGTAGRASGTVGRGECAQDLAAERDGELRRDRVAHLAVARVDGAAEA